MWSKREVSGRKEAALSKYVGSEKPALIATAQEPASVILAEKPMIRLVRNYLMRWWAPAYERDVGAEQRIGRQHVPSAGVHAGPRKDLVQRLFVLWDDLHSAFGRLATVALHQAAQEPVERDRLRLNRLDSIERNKTIPERMVG